MERYRKACILKLQYIGEKCIKDARLTGSYTDRTGNLRSSIGYVIVDRGLIAYESAFPPVKGGKEGSKEGEAYAKQLASQYGIGSGIALIVVAGMNYASYVQRRGYNVTASAELLAEQLISQLKLNAKIEHPQ